MTLRSGDDAARYRTAPHRQPPSNISSSIFFLLPERTGCVISLTRLFRSGPAEVRPGFLSGLAMNMLAAVE